jgi:hypothetical protein
VVPPLLFTDQRGLRVFGNEDTMVACSAYGGGRIWTRLTGTADPTAFTEHVAADPGSETDNWVVGKAPQGTSAVTVELGNGTTVTADLRAGYYYARLPDRPALSEGKSSTVDPVAITADTATLVYTLHPGGTVTTRPR